MDALFGVLAIISFIANIVFLILYLIALFKKNKANRKKFRNYWLIAFVLMFVCAGLMDHFSESDTSSNRSSQVKKNTSKNLPGQKINKALATKKEFYWVSKDDKKVRLFVDSNNKKITAIKVVLRPDINNTTWVQASLANVLHDNNLRYGNDKSKEENTLLSNREEYNVYSPKFKKWYWINMEPADGKNMVATYSIYPGKSDEAE